VVSALVSPLRTNDHHFFPYQYSHRPPAVVNALSYPQSSNRAPYGPDSTTLLEPVPRRPRLKPKSQRRDTASEVKISSSKTGGGLVRRVGSGKKNS